jgi:hypothetical protein
MRFARVVTLGLFAGLLGTVAMIAEAPAQEKAAGNPPAHPYVKLETTAGDILLELDGRRAPLTTKHFLSLVDAGYYDGTIFHRVIPGFMIQGGVVDTEPIQRLGDGELVIDTEIDALRLCAIAQGAVEEINAFVVGHDRQGFSNNFQ